MFWRRYARGSGPPPVTKTLFAMHAGRSIVAVYECRGECEGLEGSSRSGATLSSAPSSTSWSPAGWAGAERRHYLSHKSYLPPTPSS